MKSGEAASKAVPPPGSAAGAASPFDPRKLGCRCDECPLKLETPVPPEIPDQATRLVIGEAPGVKEVKLSRPFVGDSGILLGKWLAAVGWKRGADTGVTNALLCRPVDGDLKRYRASIRKANMDAKRQAKTANAYEKAMARMEGRHPNLVTPLLHKDPITCCAPRLYREILRVYLQARAQGIKASIVPTGNAALESLTGRAKTAITKWQGSPIKLNLRSLQYLASPPRSKKTH